MYETAANLRDISARVFRAGCNKRDIIETYLESVVMADNMKVLQRAQCAASTAAVVTNPPKCKL